MKRPNDPLKLPHIFHQSALVSMSHSTIFDLFVVPIRTGLGVTVTQCLLPRLPPGYPLRSQLSPNSNGHPDEPHHTSNDTVGDLALGRVLVEPTHHQAQAAIDHS